MPELKKCRACGVDIPSNAPFGHCPQCLLAIGFGPVPKEALESPEGPPLQSAIGNYQSPIAAVRYFGDYELLEQIGRGGMGVVFKARQISLRRLVALKMISAGELALPTAVQRFHVEAEAAAKLDHPNIVPIYEIGVHQGQHYFSMKLVEGESLEERIARGNVRKRESGKDSSDAAHSPAQFPAFSPASKPSFKRAASDAKDEVAAIMAKVARAIHYAHQHGVIHRDLKPANILLDAQGEPHLTDFGLAKILEHEIGVTRTAEVMGTPSYMSPEQAAGRQLSTATDIWSLGVVFYELLTGHPPFRAENTPALLRKIAEEEPAPPSQLRRSSRREEAQVEESEIRNPKSEMDQGLLTSAAARVEKIDRDLETICLKCLEKDPARRYASAAALADDLEHWLRHEPILARRATFFERVTKWARRQPVLAVAAVLLLVVFVLGVAGVLWQWRRADLAHRDTTRSNEQLRRALNQMDSIQRQRAEEYMTEERRLDALPRWALVLRNNPANRIAAERLMSTLSHRTWARLACPPMEHSNRVTFAMFSADGKRVVTSSADNTAWVWDAATGQRLAGPFAHSAEINTAVLSPDGRLVVTASQDKTARIWNALTGSPVTKPLQHDADVSTAHFSPDGKLILTTSERFGQLWSVSTGQRVGAAFQGTNYIQDAGFSPDGSRVALACAGGQAQLWDVAAGTCLHRLQHGGKVWSLEFSPDGKWLVTASYDKTARVWEVASGKSVCEPLRHQEHVLSARFSPDGQRIVTASSDHTAQIWDLRTGQKIGAPLKHDGDVRSGIFSPEGLRVVTASQDKTVRVWDALTGEPLTEPMAHDSTVFGAQFSPDDERILTASNGKSVLIWEVIGTSALTIHLPVHVGSVEFSPDSKSIVIAADGSNTRVWGALTGQPLTPPLTDPPHISMGHVVFSPDGKLLASVSEDGNARIWSASDGRLLAGPMRHWDNVRWLGFSPDGRRLLTTFDYLATIWDARSGARLLEIRHEGRLSQPASFSPDGMRVLTATETGIARVWHARSGEPVTPPLSHATNITTAQFSPDGRFVLTTARDASFFIWEIGTGRQLEKRWPHRDPVLSAFYSADGRSVLTSTLQYGAQVWDLENRCLIDWGVRRARPHRQCAL